MSSDEKNDDEKASDGEKHSGDEKASDDEKHSDDEKASDKKASSKKASSKKSSSKKSSGKKSSGKKSSGKTSSGKKSSGKKSSGDKSSGGRDMGSPLKLALVAVVVAVGAWLFTAKPWVDLGPFGDALERLDTDRKSTIDTAVARPMLEASKAALDARKSDVDLPDALASDSEDRMLFVTVADGTEDAKTFFGHGKGWEAALEVALGHAVSTGNTSATMLRLDVVERTSDARIADARLEGFDPGFHGLAFPTEIPVAFAAQELVANRLVDKVKPELELENLGKYMRKRGVAEPIVTKVTSGDAGQPYALQLASFFWDAPQDDLVAVVASHPRETAMEPDDLLERVTRGADYLVRAQDHRGRYIYDITPGDGNDDQDAWAANPDKKYDSHDVDRGYNMLRHAGTTFSIAQAYGATKEPRFEEAARKGIEYMLRKSERDPNAQGEQLAVIDKDSIKVGGNGLALVAIAEYTKATGDRKYVAQGILYGNWLVETQFENGDWHHKRELKSGKVHFKNGVEWKSGYYPGEAILGLVQLYTVQPDEKYLDAAEKAARYLNDVRDKGRPTKALEPDHWLLYGLEALHNQRQDPRFLEHANRVIDRIVGGQNTTLKRDDNNGSYGPKPYRATPAATRCEGLIAAYRLMRKNEAPDARLKEIWDSVELGMRFTLQHQMGPERTMQFAHGATYDGAFTHSLTDMSIRIDYIQHSVSAMLGFRGLLLER